MNPREIRPRLLRAFNETPKLERYSAVLVLWCFPHLEPIDVAWTFLSARSGSGGLVRIASWNKFDPRVWAAADTPSEIHIQDSPLSEEELLISFELLSRFQVIGDQKGGIYDGPLYGREIFNDRTGETIDVQDWILEDTFRSLSLELPDWLKLKMRWAEFAV